MDTVKTATMRAVRFHAYGEPAVMVQEDVVRPRPEAGEVLIRVHAAGVNPVDWKIRGGHLKDWLKHRLPLIPGWDVSGVIEEVGQGVREFAKRDEVFGILDRLHDGAYAEYAIGHPNELALKPESIDHIHAAALPIAALTAWQAIFEIGRLSEGQTILIHAAAGGVGHMAVQFARWKGARVIGTASSENESFLRELGADQVIDYRKARFEDVVSNVDMVLDTMAGDIQKRSWKVLRKGGILVSLLGITDPNAPATQGVRGEAFHVHPDSAQLSEIASLIEKGAVKVVIASILPLSEASKAHELSQSGRIRGKIVLRVRD